MNFRILVPIGTAALIAGISLYAILVRDGREGMITIADTAPARGLARTGNSMRPSARTELASFAAG